MNSTYRILFFIEILHEYYTNLVCRDFSILPSEETAVLMKDRQMICKVAGNKLILLSKVHPEGADKDKPFVPIEPDDRFIFHLDLQSVSFTSITNLDADQFREKKRFYFTNLHQNKFGSVLNLTAGIDNYQNGSSYKPGDLVNNGSGEIFENIKLTAGGNNTTNLNYWRTRQTNQFVSSEDMLQFVPSVSTFRTSVAAKEFSIKAFALNFSTNVYDREIDISNKRLTADTLIQDVKVDLSELPPGRYKITINTDQFDVYVDNYAVHKNMSGVVEIFSHLPAISDFSFFDPSGTVKDKIVAGVPQWLTYTIRFANRLAFWKYVTPRKGVKAIVDKTSAFAFSQSPVLPSPADFFESNLPIPLKQKPAIYELELNSPISLDPLPAPNPDPQTIGMLTRKDPGKDYYCTIYLNY